MVSMFYMRYYFFLVRFVSDKFEEVQWGLTCKVCVRTDRWS